MDGEKEMTPVEAAKKTRIATTVDRANYIKVKHALEIEGRRFHDWLDEQMTHFLSSR